VRRGAEPEAGDWEGEELGGENGEESCAVLCGTYEEAGSNSTLVVDKDAGPGLVITSWVNNGTDILNTLMPSIYASPLIGPARLYPTGLQSSGRSEDKSYEEEKAYRVIFPVQSQEEDGLAVFSDGCQDWEAFDVLSYGNIGLDDLVFRVGGQGEGNKGVKGVELRGFRKVLGRV